ncbi:MAG TPA: bifunctional glutamate N-acetyltransferase/amino-acid acetyltransferase ArgJ [Candidatus Limnocylindria bacterium]|nr:bifunctional glutamate N-acetyltransferase/amino-acid acetyltransferase ArgJ [Candidatus Limnocylindria bacterium]
MTGRGVTYAAGFTAGAAAAGVKHGGAERLDVALIVSDRPCVAAGVLTTNRAIAAPCVVTRRHLERGSLRAIVANSGNANAATGRRGERDAMAMAQAAARHLGVAAEEVAVASTGVIGVPLPIERIAAVIPGIVPTVDGWEDAARAIMTTDTKPKVAEQTVALSGGDVRVGGIAKGAGMIHPDMATLLAFITTDAEVDPRFLRKATKAAVAETFNRISVDGDTSTNDTVIVLANGASGQRVTRHDDEDKVRQALVDVCRELALAVLADGEGVTKVFRVTVDGAKSVEEAVLAARTITDSNLVRTAVHGADPNYGRILAAAGRSGAELDLAKAGVRIGATPVFLRGAPCPYDVKAVRAHLAQGRVELGIYLGAGESSAEAWGADLSAEYVRINADYTT